MTAPIRDRRPALAAGALACIALVLAWRGRNVVDDAFIYFRYAEHFARGDGLVWNRGERVDGATSFLWMLLLGLAVRLGADPLHVTAAVGLLALAGALALACDVTTRTLRSPWWGLAAVGLLGTNAAILASGTEGLGTHLLTVALLGTMALASRLGPQPSLGQLAACSVVAAAAVLVRLDAALPIAIILAPPAWRFVAARAWRDLAALVGPLGAIALAWALWHWGYYGTFLPNTFWVKAAGVQAFAGGLYYLYAFVLSYLLLPQLVLIGAALARSGRATPVPIAVAAAVTAAWCLYVASIGGDFIGYRFLVPILPFGTLCLLWALQTTVENRAVRAGVLLLTVAGSLHHALAFGSVIWPNAVHRPSLRILAAPGPEAQDPILWAERQTGEYLGAVLGYDPTVTIAVGAAGLIPYYSKLGAIDIMGLNDAWVARHGTPLRFEQYVGGVYPGHVRLATISYLRQRGAHLLLGPGALVRDDVAASVRTMGDLLTAMFLGDPRLARSTGIRKGDFAAGTEVLLIPVRPGYTLLALYLTRHPRIDTVAAAQGWRRYPLDGLPE